MEIGNIFGYKFYADNIYGYKNLRKRAGNSKFKFTFLQGYEILSQPQKTLLLSLISRIKKYLMPNIISQSIRIVGQKVFLHFKLSLSFPPFFVPINFVPIICVPKNMAKFHPFFSALIRQSCKELCTLLLRSYQDSKNPPAPKVSWH